MRPSPSPQNITGAVWFSGASTLPPGTLVTYRVVSLGLHGNKWEPIIKQAGKQKITKMSIIRKRSLDELTHREITESYRAYLNGKEPLSWVVGKIRQETLPKGILLQTLSEVDNQKGLDETTRPRSEELRKELSRLGLI